MASIVAMGKMREQAMNRIEAATGITLPTQGRDTELKHIRQLSVIADYLEAAAASPAVLVQDPRLESALEVLNQGNWTKADMVAALTGEPDNGDTDG